MKSLRFHELLLVSQSEKRAKRIPFKTNVTIIRGANDTGKSSILKSIYWTLGAEPVTIHKKWKDAQVTSSLRFSVDGTHYRMIRDGNRYLLFDKEDKPLALFGSVTKELSPYYARLFDFHLVLQTHDSAQKERQATPLFLFFPYYLDQDGAWSSTQRSFQNVGQFINPRTDTIHFHAGIKPSEYYLAKARLTEAEREVSTLRDERKVYEHVLKTIRTRMSQVDFDIDINTYRDELNQLLDQCKSLNEQESELKEEMTEAHRLKWSLAEQIELATATGKELIADLEFASLRSNEQLTCPLCSTPHDNGFAERLALAMDEDACTALLKELRDNLEDAERRWAAANARVTDIRKTLAELDALLTTVRGQLTLKDVLRREGQKEVSGDLHRDIDAINLRIGQEDEKSTSARSEMQRLTDKDKQEEINRFYFDNMKRIVQRLRIENVDDQSFRKIEAKVNETGSDLPRAILAYHLALLRTIKKYSSSTFCPIVLDSPRQQDQDENNWRLILEAIRDEVPPDSQLILALITDAGVSLGGEVIDVDDEYHLLNEKDYPQAIAELRPLLFARP
jgi:hypothetical protein